MHFNVHDVLYSQCSHQHVLAATAAIVRVVIYSVVCYNEWSYNERMLQRTVFINKIRMLQRTRRNTIGWRSTCMHIMCRAFPCWLQFQWSSLLSFVRFSYQFSSVSCWFVPLAVKIFFFSLFCYIILAMSRQNRVRKLINWDIKKECLNGCVGWELCSRLWAWNGLPLNTHISMYARTNRCYNEWGSKTNYVCSSIPHCNYKNTKAQMWLAVSPSLHNN
jgi:hypothetical protein